ncbi:MAG: hypothetical protein SCH39_01375 [Methanosarcinales archaeon]|nr:hypothetical protein [ANME-2 cluster archaeon]MDW7774971.1 hypothetical protein [Methanosarcinales archaeon]
MANIFEDIRNTVDGVVGSYLMNMNGEIIAHDVPKLFENELFQSSSGLFQLIDIFRSRIPINSLEVKADQGYIQLAVNKNYILGTFASKHADESLLNLIVKKAITTIKPEDLAAMRKDAQGTQNPTAKTTSGTASATVHEAEPGSGQEISPPAHEVPSSSAPAVKESGSMIHPETGEVPDEVRVALCQAVKGKVRIMYGDKRAEVIVTEAFQQIGANRDTRNAQELKSVFNILACGIMAKMMGETKARKFLDDLYDKHGLK